MTLGISAISPKEQAVAASLSNFGGCVSRTRVMHGHSDRVAFADELKIAPGLVRRIEKGELHGLPIEDVVKVIGAFKLDENNRQHLAALAAEALISVGNHPKMVKSALSACWSE